MDLEKKKKILIGKIIRSYGSSYQVDLGEQTVSCTLRGKFRHQSKENTNPVVVGDEVEIIMDEKGEGVIEKILPRKTQLSRPSPKGNRLSHIVVANVTQAVIVATPRQPEVSLGFIDRVLMACADYEILPLLCINKTDLVEEESLKEYQEIYGNFLSVIFTSAEKRLNMHLLKEKLQGQTSVFVGQSGVGKSSLLNLIEPNLSLTVGEISQATNKGTHTTTSASLLKLSFGGYVVDTPGLKEFGLRKIPAEEVSYYFPEMEEHLPFCKFKGCRHLTEPQCGVKKAVAEGKVHLKRYKSYCLILESLH